MDSSERLARKLGWDVDPTARMNVVGVVLSKRWARENSKARQNEMYAHKRKERRQQRRQA